MFCKGCQYENYPMFLYLHHKKLLQVGVIWKCPKARTKEMRNFSKYLSERELEAAKYSRISLHDNVEEILEKCEFLVKKDCPNYVDNLICSNVSSFD